MSENRDTRLLINMEEKKTRLTDYFGANLATLLAEKICFIYPEFDRRKFVKSVQDNCFDKSLTGRVELIADKLKIYLPEDYVRAIAMLVDIMGEENAKETGMFTDFYWLMPIGKFIEKYGLEHYDASIHAIAELTKSNTGEFSIRPYIRTYPTKTIKQMKKWAKSDNFHLRRLSSEGLRPKLPWAAKLDLFIENPKPVFEILNLLKTEEIMFVKKSVANHLADYIKVNPEAAFTLIDGWRKIDNKHTQWMLKRATRKLK